MCGATISHFTALVAIPRRNQGIESNDMPDEKDSGFKITDRRKFNLDGTLRTDQEESTAQQAPEAALSGAQAQPAETARVISFPGDSGKRKEKLPEADPEPDIDAELDSQFSNASAEDSDASFENLINMLAVEAVMHMGLIENPMGGRTVDLDAARHMIDMLGMLHQKTRGNLTHQEAELIENILGDLRIQFIELSKKR